MAVAIAVAATLGAWRQETRSPLPEAAWFDQAAAVRGIVDAVPVRDGRWQRLEVAVDRYRGEEGWHDGSARVAVVAPLTPRVRVGDEILLVGPVTAVEDEAPGYREYLRGRGCTATMFARTARVEVPGSGWRRAVAAGNERFAHALRRASPGDAGALLVGLVTGDDAALSDERRAAFRATGTSHITAVSGSNLGVLVAVFASAGGAAGWRRRWWWQVATVAGVWAYAVVVGLEPPVVRAALFASAVILAGRLGRRPDYLTLLVLGAALMVAVRPGDLWSLSFQLSFASALAIAAWVRSRPRGPLGWLGTGLGATTLAQVATLPVLLPAFGTVALASIPANLLVGPLVAIAFPLAAVAGLVGLVVPPLGDALAVTAGLFADTVFAVVDTFGAGSGGSVEVGRPSLPARLLVGLLAGSVVLLASVEGRRFLGRLAARAGIGVG